MIAFSATTIAQPSATATMNSISHIGTRYLKLGLVISFGFASQADNRARKTCNTGNSCGDSSGKHVAAGSLA
jgi:hypothetical protein